MANVNNEKNFNEPEFGFEENPSNGLLILARIIARHHLKQLNDFKNKDINKNNNNTLGKEDAR
jgi:hypothetical protein